MLASAQRVHLVECTTAAIAECTSESHNELKANPAAWWAQEPRGIQSAFGDGPDLELRNCNLCQSTLCVACGPPAGETVH